MKYHKKETAKTRLPGLHEENQSVQEQEDSMKPTLRRIVRSMTKEDSRVKRLRQSIDQSNDIVQRLHTALLETGCDHCLHDNLNFYVAGINIFDTTPDEVTNSGSRGGSFESSPGAMDMFMPCPCPGRSTGASSPGCF